MGKEKDSKGSNNMFDELTTSNSLESSRRRDRKDRKSSKRERSRDRSKNDKKHRRRSFDEADDNNGRKNRESTSNQRRRIRWEHDDKMIRMRYFRVNDEPIADGLSETQVKDLRERLVKESAIIAASQSQSRAAENAAKGQNSAENIAWTKPKGVFRGENDKYAFGQKSHEKKEHEKRISTKISCYFAREYQIPDRPTLNQTNPAAPKFHKIAQIHCELYKPKDFDTPVDDISDQKSLSGVSYLTEKTRVQLEKKIGRSSMKKVEEESEPSEYSDISIAPEVDEKDELIPIAQFAGLMGQCFSNYKGYIRSLNKRINALDDAEKEKVRQNISLIKNIFESNSKVLAVNSSKTMAELGGGGVRRNSNAPDKNALKNVNKNYKTKPCNNFHSELGCGRNEGCHFIHDWEYKGRPIPEPDRSGKMQPKFQRNNSGGAPGSHSSLPMDRSRMGGNSSGMSNYPITQPPIVYHQSGAGSSGYSLGGLSSQEYLSSNYSQLYKPPQNGGYGMMDNKPMSNPLQTSGGGYLPTQTYMKVMPNSGPAPPPRKYDN